MPSHAAGSPSPHSPPQPRLSSAQFLPAAYSLGNRFQLPQLGAFAAAPPVVAACLQPCAQPCALPCAVARTSDTISQRPEWAPSLTSTSTSSSSASSVASSISSPTAVFA